MRFHPNHCVNHFDLNHKLFKVENKAGTETYDNMGETSGWVKHL